MLIDVVILGGPPFQKGANQTSLQTFEELSRKKNVLYVGRQFQESAVRRWAHRGGKSVRSDLPPGLHQVGESKAVLILPPIFDLLPLIRPEFSRKIACHVLKSCLRKTLEIEFRSGHSVDLIAYWWMFPEICASFPWSNKLFDVIDRHWGYSHLKTSAARRRNFSLAIATSKQSDQVTCVTSALADELRSAIRSVKVLPNGVDLARVDSAVIQRAGKRNTAVYVGGWNDRIDFALLLEVVEGSPDWSFQFIGGAPDDRFKKCQNVEFLGDVPYETVVECLSQAKVGLLPFNSSNYTIASSFLKVLDYLACGTWVAATDLTPLHGLASEYPERVRLLNSPDEWTALLRALGSVPEKAQSRPDLRAHSVEQRVADLIAANP